MYLIDLHIVTYSVTNHVRIRSASLRSRVPNVSFNKPVTDEGSCSGECWQLGGLVFTYQTAAENPDPGSEEEHLHLGHARHLAPPY